MRAVVWFVLVAVWWWCDGMHDTRAVFASKAVRAFIGVGRCECVWIVNCSFVL
jgi:hypothetical protein